MFKKKNNIICFIMIAVALVGGLTTTYLDYTLNNNTQTVSTAYQDMPSFGNGSSNSGGYGYSSGSSGNSGGSSGNSGYGSTDGYSNDSSSTNPFGNSESQITPMNNATTPKYQMSVFAKGTMITCGEVFSLAVVYLIMSKLSTRRVFINQDKKWIYGLGSCLLTIVIAFSCIKATGLINVNNSSTNQQTTTEEGII